MPALTTAQRGVLVGLVAAVTFGISAPLAKVLLDDVRPQLLAGLLYLGAFGALSLRRRSAAETPLRPADRPRLAAMVLAGGIAAPVLLLLGLERTTGVAGSLLLNLEGPLTILVGVVVFREHLPRRSLSGAAVILAGAALLTVERGATRVDVPGVLLIAAACACWAIDNNLTQSLTLRDPRSLVRIKAGVAGSVNTVIVLAAGSHLPAPRILLAVLALGALCYGISVYLDALALRALGAAREAAVFAVAPFAGALLAPFVLAESIGLEDLIAGSAMACGIALLLSDRHEHAHRHLPLDHEHVHTHDAHHHHEHGDADAAGEPHAHRHRHSELVHAHPHVSDIHHRHEHVG